MPMHIRLVARFAQDREDQGRIRTRVGFDYDSGKQSVHEQSDHTMKAAKDV